jgi:hypothetical protein
MNIEFKLSDAFVLHDKLNPTLFNDTKLDEPVRDQLLAIAEDFISHLGVKDIDVIDIIIAGSNAAYSYTAHSDIDLHIIVDMSKIEDDIVYRELFTAKKNVYNDTHDILIRGSEVELYVEPSNESVKSLGVYSVLKDKWIKFPSKMTRSVPQEIAARKFEKLMFLSAMALKSKDLSLVESLIATIKKYRRAGLAQAGEFSVENIAYKALRSNGIVDKLYKLRDRLHSHQLSLKEVELNECSGYIPSESEKDDPRWERALSVDVHPDTMKRQAKLMGLGSIARDGRPQQSRVDGKFRK